MKQPYLDRVKEALWDMHIRSCLGWSSRRMTWTRSLISEQRLMKLCHFDAKGIFTPRWFLCLQSQAGFPSFHAEMFFPAYLTDYRMIWFIHSFFLSFFLSVFLSLFLSLVSLSFLSFFLMLLSSYLSYPIFYPCCLSSRHPLLPSFRTSCCSRGQTG